MSRVLWKRNFEKERANRELQHLLGVSYEEGVRIILQVKESIRPEVGNRYDLLLENKK